MQKDTLQSAGESTLFRRLNAFESSPLGGGVMTSLFTKETLI